MNRPDNSDPNEQDETEADITVGCLACGVAVSALLQGVAPDEATIATVLTVQNYGADDVLGRIRSCPLHKEMLEGMETRAGMFNS